MQSTRIAKRKALAGGGGQLREKKKSSAALPGEKKGEQGAGA